MIVNLIFSRSLINLKHAHMHTEMHTHTQITTPKHIITQLLKTNNKEKVILEAVRENRYIMYRKKMVRETKDFYKKK